MSIIQSIKNKTKRVLAKGFIDDIDGCSIRGWACSLDSKPIKIRLYVNGKLIRELTPDAYRQDLKEAKIGDGRFGFELDLEKSLIGGTNKIKMSTLIGSKEFVINEKEFLVKSSSNPNSKVTHSLVQGKIDRFVGNQVHGWVGCIGKDVYPYLTVNGKPCEIVSYGLERKDVQTKMGLSENTGFIARVPELEYGLIDIELNAISMNELESVDKQTIRGGSVVPDSIACIYKALEISKQKNAVGIVVWEGTHNPIGRAQVLYNVLKEHRPTIIISFNIGFSDKPVWQPLLNSDCCVLMLPWKDRDMYANLFKDIGLNFDLVWICKPRYPAFVLAEYISHEDTRYIIDLDDNELEMSSSKASTEKPYGLLSAKMAQKYIDRIQVRSVASQSLKNDFGGELVRHARANMPVKREREKDLSKPVRVGFIGTIRPHKGVVEAAKAIKELNERKGYNIKFVVGGIYDPSSIRSELITLGCEVHGEIDSSRLAFHLQNLDVIITGFPDSSANKEILKYQISSKIGDGLSNERTVLVPEGISVADLKNIPGIYLFNTLNFERMLEKAITHSEQVQMDEQFTLSWNYQQFLKLEGEAYKTSPKARDLFRVKNKSHLSQQDDKQKVVLVWKQHDTGLYGRRVDHIARTLVENNIDVTCLEVINQEQFKRYDSGSDRVDADWRYIVDDYRDKVNGYCENGINYKTISIDHTQQTESALKQYLIKNKIFPTNTKIILFPAVPDWKAVTKVFEGYQIICDVVDNQLGWEKKQPLALLQQYKKIMDISRCVIFNSEENRQFFEQLGFLKELDVHVIPNWYKLPLDYINDAKVQGDKNGDKKQKTHFDIVYSGNMNDRFDWDTVSRIPNEIDLPVRVHLIGNCQRALDKMTMLLDDPSIIYHGPMRESELLEFMKGCDLAIMPHIHDEHSGFMNPMKVNMYKAVEIPCLVSSMPGVDLSSDCILVANNSDEFISVLNEFLSGNIIKNVKFGDANTSGEVSYLRVIK